MRVSGNGDENDRQEVGLTYKLTGILCLDEDGMRKGRGLGAKISLAQNRFGFFGACKWKTSRIQQIRYQ